MSPTFANGKICYLEIPAVDVEASARFYEAVFGWQLRRRDDGSVAFDDGVTEVAAPGVPTVYLPRRRGSWSTSWSKMPSRHSPN